MVEEINKIYKDIVKLRKKVKSNKKIKKYYDWLKDYNKNDILYGWEFEDDCILEDTKEFLLSIYDESDVYNILKQYKSDLEYMIERGGK